MNDLELKKKLKKEINNMGSTLMRQEEYLEELKGRVKSAELIEKNVKDNLAKLEAEFQEKRKKFLVGRFRKAEFEEISKKHNALRELQEKIRAQNVDLDIRIKEINVLSTQLRAENDRLDKDKKDVSDQNWKLQEQAASLRTKESDLLEEATNNNKYSKRLREIEANLSKQQEKNKSQLEYISEQLAEISKKRKDNVLKANELDSHQRDINKEDIELDKQRVFTANETQKLGTLRNSLDKQLEKIEVKEKSYKELSRSLRDYENELELKRLILISEARKKNVKMKIKKLTKE